MAKCVKCGKLGARCYCAGCNSSTHKYCAQTSKGKHYCTYCVVPKTIEVFEIDPGQEVSCYFCLQNSATKRRSYKRGEAYLCGADHQPCNGNANYICKTHLEKDVVILDSTRK